MPAPHAREGARPLSPAPSPYLCAVVGPPAWLVWGVNAFLPFAVGSLGVVFLFGSAGPPAPRLARFARGGPFAPRRSARSLAALFVWQRTRMRLALAVGGVAALAFWLASGWLAWVVTR